ncbi:uncharacterized protein LOC143146141 [Ptiloglossa arizonensis]|uniref:uncharacterized protein LOC143146141 n=1 Tax=Ptiloglossa arizonensis TaxID=3350558 RepID=UPI003F9F2B15
MSELSDFGAFGAADASWSTGRVRTQIDSQRSVEVPSAPDRSRPPGSKMDESRVASSRRNYGRYNGSQTQRAYRRWTGRENPGDTLELSCLYQRQTERENKDIC